MLAYQESVRRFEELKTRLGIPADADLAFVEKRHIEQLPQGEIEAMEGASTGSQEGGEATDPGDAETGISQRLAWVGEYSLGFMFWELAIDAQGRLVRLRKSR